MIKRLIPVLLLTAFIALPVLSEDKAGFSAKVYEVKNRNVDDIAKLLIGLDVDLVTGSINPALKTFTVRADEKGHEAVAALIKKFDIPIKNIEFQFFLLKAGTDGEELKGGLPDKVLRAVKEVASLTRYKAFEIIDSPFILTKEDSSGASLTGKGLYRYEINVGKPTIRVSENGSFQISINYFWARFYVEGVTAEGKPITRSATFSTPFNLDDGQIVVLGASQIDRTANVASSAIITIVTARIY